MQQSGKKRKTNRRHAQRLVQQAQAVTFTVSAPLMSAGINTGLGYLSQKPREPKRKNHRAIETAIPSYAEPQDNTAFLHFYCGLMFTATFNSRNRWGRSQRPMETAQLENGTGHRPMGSLSHRQPSLEQKNINKSLFFIPVDGNISWHPSDDKPFFPVTSANSVTMATASSAMTSLGFPGNCSQGSDVMWSPWQCSMRPGRKYFKWEDRSETTKEGSGKSRIKDN